MNRYKHNHRAVTLLGYAGVLYAAVAVFAVTLFGSAAIGSAHTEYTFPAQHWVLAAGSTVLVVGVVLSAVHTMLTETPLALRRRL